MKKLAHTECDLAPAGYYVPRDGAPSDDIQICGPGSFSAQGADDCTLCPPGTYASAAGTADECTSCGPGMTTPVGSTSEAACGCEVGKYLSADGTSCIECEEGFTCRGGSLARLQQAGYYARVETAARRLQDVAPIITMFR